MVIKNGIREFSDIEDVRAHLDTLTMEEMYWCHVHLDLLFNWKGEGPTEVYQGEPAPTKEQLIAEGKW